MKKCLIIIILGILNFYSFGQTPFGNNIVWLSGYQKSVSGETIGYFSAFPDYVNEALLTRTTDGKKVIEWLTVPVPQTPGPYIYFRWIAAHSSGTSGGDRKFDLYINGAKTLTITTLPGNKNPDWSFAAADSTKISFIQLKRDGNQDAHGIAYLRVPAAKLKPGEPVDLKIVGAAQESNDWFMTFKYSFQEKADLTGLPFLLKNGQQVIMLNVLHFGGDQTLRVTVNQATKLSFRLRNGMNSFDLPVTATKKPDSVHVSARYADTTLFDGFVKIDPVIEREIDFIPHSHTDIGYSHLQPEVEKIHIKNIYDALRMIAKTKDYPEASKFKWNVESLWAAENFLRQASHNDSIRFFNAVKDNSIGLSGMYANMMTGLSTPEETFHYFDYAKVLRSRFQLPIESAMITDVPGLEWATVTALAKSGIKYFSDGPNYLGKNNPYEGDRVGYFVKEWGDKPVWWLSPSGRERILFWTAGRGYSSWHGTPPGGIFYSGAKKIATYLTDLAKEKYPYKIVQWRYNIVSDNGPIDTTISDFVKQWNEKFASPKIVLTTVSSLFERFEKQYGKSIPTVKGDISPYWMDGAASTAKEEGDNRVNSFRLQQLSTLYSMIDPLRYDSGQFYQAWRNTIMFTEHTWGAFNSISAPDLDFVKEQWKIKKDFLLHANSQIEQLYTALIDPFSDPASNTIAVINTLSWARSGPVYIDDISGYDFVTDDAGGQFPLQTLQDGRQIFVAQNLRPLSVSYFTLVKGKIKKPLKSPFTITANSLSNGIVNISWDKSNGSITNIEKDRFNYCGTYADHGLNAYWYVPGRDPGRAQTNDSVTTVVQNDGAYMATVSFIDEAPGSKKLMRSITLHAGDDRIYLTNKIDKKDVRSKEGVYFAFPFNRKLLHTTMDVGYGSMTYLKDQLPGSNMDFVSPHTWLDISDGNRGIQLMALEPFMMAPDSMVDERLQIDGSFKKWKKTGAPTATWFSYVMNNYWHTNFKIDQEGTADFHYCLRPHNYLNDEEQQRASMEFTQPLVVFKVNMKKPMPRNQFEQSNDCVVVTCVTPLQKGGLELRVFNPTNNVQKSIITWKGFDQQTVTLAPMDVKEIYLIK